MELLDFLEVINEIYNTVKTERWIMIIVFFVYIIASIVQWCFQKKYDARLEKNLSEYSSKLSCMQNLLERDEATIRDIKVDIIIEGNKKRIALYKDIYHMYFEVLYMEEKKTEEVCNIKRRLVELRNRCFVESIYWGRLTENLVRAVIALNDWAFDKSVYAAAKNNNLLKQIRDDSSNAIEQLGIIQDFIQKNMCTATCLNDIDIADDEKVELQKKRREILDLKTKEEKQQQNL